MTEIHNNFDTKDCVNPMDVAHELTENVMPTKANYRKSKIDHAAAHDRHIESIKRDIERAKEYLARERARK